MDAFGRLIKKVKADPPATIVHEPSTLSKHGETLRALSETPDLSALESKFEKPDNGLMKPTQLKGLQIVPDEDIEHKKQLQNLPSMESLEIALVDTQNVVEQKAADEVSDKTSTKAKDLFDKDPISPFSSIVDAIAEDESTSPSDIFGIPEVSYEEIPVDKKPDESNIQPPDLKGLFSDALSELGSISGESGGFTKGKKKKSKK
ncbi:MAG: hypothetical protein ACTSRJ_04320 [Candidatus Hodarchaeales archaeon]